MSTNPNSERPAQPDSFTSEPEENLSLTAWDASFSELEFDHDHGTEVDGALREIQAQWEAICSAA
jgi:hypothetical protein